MSDFKDWEKNNNCKDCDSKDSCFIYHIVSMMTEIKENIRKDNEDE